MVHFVGAGPGAADLITLRGAKLLGEADVVVWAGSLVNPELLGLCREGCEIFDSSRLNLEETTEILCRADRGGRMCVRLHTGDPCLFGAIREQMEELSRLGVEYDVVPGVSSFCGAASAIKREYTVPGVSQTVIISRMEGKTPVPRREGIAELSRHGASMVLFLSSGMIRELCVELLKGGAYKADTPCCVVYKATWADERIVEGTLSDIADRAEAAGIKKTALVLVGDFLGGTYERSLLYDKMFSTEFRKAEKK